MATLRIPISGRSERTNQVIRQTASVTLILTTAEVEDGDVQLTLEIVEKGLTTTENAGMVTQAALSALLLNETP